jgi:hypothetical protein
VGVGVGGSVAVVVGNGGGEGVVIGGRLLQTYTLPHKNRGIANQDKSQRLETAVNQIKP